MTETRTPELSIILLSYNRLELTQKAVKNILTETRSVDFELIVVDNDSNDGTQAFLESIVDPRVQLICNPKNLYFGGGNNVGLEACKGQFVILTQNDMTFAADSMRNLIDLFQKLPNAGCVGIGGGFINTAGIISEISNWWKNPLRQFESIEVDFISGCCMLFNRHTIIENRIAFDTNYRLYWEDVDLSHQFASCGYTLHMLHNGLIGTRHLRSGTITPLLGEQERERIRQESNRYYLKKWAHFFSQTENLVPGIRYRHFFHGLRFVTVEDCLSEEIRDYRCDAQQIRQYEFLEFRQDYHEAIKGYKKVVKANPDNFLAYRNLCRAVFYGGSIAENKDLVKGFQNYLKPSTPTLLRKQLYMYIQSAILRIARNYADSGDYQSAYHCFDELQSIAQTAPTIALCEIEKAKMNYLMGYFDQAEKQMLAWLQKTDDLDLDPMMTTAAYFYLGEMAHKRGDSDTAADRYNLTLSIEANHNRARSRLRELTGR